MNLQVWKRTGASSTRIQVSAFTVMPLPFSLGEISRVRFGFVGADNDESFYALENWNSRSWTDFFLNQENKILYVLLYKPAKEIASWSFQSIQNKAGASQQRDIRVRIFCYTSS